MLDAVETKGLVGLIVRGEPDAGYDLNNEKNAEHRTEVPEIVDVPGGWIARYVLLDELGEGKALIYPIDVPGHLAPIKMLKKTVWGKLSVERFPPDPLQRLLVPEKTPEAGGFLRKN
ncbi:MAG: hypothetical protein HS130_12880 [Deltaproteobacteria bacterium]|nr:hypothetical protein [Deltaproteobacteria bacterium]